MVGARGNSPQTPYADSQEFEIAAGRGIPTLRDRTRPMRRLPLLLALLALTAAAPLRAAFTEWTDAEGQAFKGEPIQLFGSLALFRTGGALVKRVPLRALSAEQCQRFHAALAARPARSATWATATGNATRELTGAVQRLEPQYRRMVPADLKDRPEPELLFVLVGAHSDPASWNMLNNVAPSNQRIQHVYPGVVGTVFFGRAHSTAEHQRMSIEMWASWLATDYYLQSNLTILNRRAPRDYAAMLVLTRDGDLLLSARADGTDSVRRFVDDFTLLLWAANPANPRAWADLTHYGKVTRPLEYADAATGPLLVGNPLKAEGLRQRGIGRIVARIEVDADGKPVSTTLQPGSSVPDALAPQLTEALTRNTVFLPAIDHGKAVGAGYDFVMEVPPADPSAEADAAWLDGGIRAELPLLDWMVLKPIAVNQRDFDEIAGVDVTGKVTLQAMEVSKAKVSRASQLNAFNSDWFGEAGAGSVQPKIGESLTVDGSPVTWRGMHTDSGYVDMHSGEPHKRDYCVGYAWTEIEVTAATRAWLSIGSDDGLKIWHNGVLVHDRWARRVSQVDGDIVPLQLKKPAETSS